MNCLICDSAKLSNVGAVETSKHFDVVQCKECRFVFTLPRPSQEELIAHYGADYFTNSSKEAGYNDYYTIGEMNMRAMWPSFKEYMGRVYQNEQTILDVGCASGAFLLEAKKDGWVTKGIELSDDAVLRATSEYNLDVKQGDIFCNELKLSPFNVITMWHVLEHTLQPIDVLRRAYALLTPGGVVFIELPNWNSLGRILKGTRWKQLVPPAHLNFFIRQSMRKALERVGFEVIRCSTHNVAGIDKLRARSAKVVIPMIDGVAAAVGYMGCGGYLRALARKPERSRAGMFEEPHLVS